MSTMRLGLLLLLLLLSVALNADKKKKNVLDLTERDVQKIYEQWEVKIWTPWHDLYSSLTLLPCFLSVI